MNAKVANNTKEKVRQLQRKLYLTAKKGKRRFHALYDKIYRKEVLQEAWSRVRTNRGVGGIDGIGIEEVEEYGAEKLLTEIEQDLITGNYRPKPVLRVEIPKSDGSKRPLGIPTIKDRIVQMATKIVIEPLFESDFKDCSYGFRPKRSAHQALEVVRKACNNNGAYVIDADIKGYFNNINHDKLMKLVELRISDRKVLKLIRKWLKVGAMVNGRYEESTIGSPQGGVISPLLANIYLNYLDTVWIKHGNRYGKLVRYADDLVVICKNKKQCKNAFNLLQKIMERLELELSPAKTKIVDMWDGEEGFDFLGMYHKRMTKTTREGKKYRCTGQIPSNKAMNKMRETVRRVVCRRSVLACDVEKLIKELNPIIRGWRNYYGIKTARKSLNKIDWYIIQSLTRWYNKKRQKRNLCADGNKFLKVISNLGLQRISGYS